MMWIIVNDYIDSDDLCIYDNEDNAYEEYQKRKAEGTSYVILAKILKTAEPA